MKAVQINNYGGVDQLNVVDVEKPRIGADQVLVEVYASSINPADSGMREGNLKGMFDPNFPVTLGGDIAGKIVEVGENVNKWQIGDKVYGQAYVFFGESGAYAEYAAVSANRVAKLPNGLDFETAASLPLVGVSAVQAVIDNAKLKAEQKMLIHGGAGAVGAMAIELAKHIGAYVATTVSEKDMDFAKSLGADEVINYKTQDFSEILKEYDTVIDLVADPTATGEVFKKSIDVLKPGGTLVTLVAFKGGDQLQEAKTKGINAVYQLSLVTTDSLNQLSDYVNKGVIKPRVARTFPMTEIREAFALRETENPGKIVIKMR